MRNKEFQANFGRMFESIGFSSIHDTRLEPRVQKAMATVQESCGTIVYKDIPPLLVGAFVADDLSVESIIGRFVVLEEKITAFKEFAISTRYTGQIAVVGNILVVFENHNRCADFRLEVQAKCKKVQFLKKVHVLPWAVDLEKQRVHRHEGWPFKFVDFLSESKLERGLF